MRDQNEIWRLMSRSIFGEASPEEEKALHEILRKQPEMQLQFDLLAATLKKSSPDAEIKPASEANEEKVRDILEKAGQIEVGNKNFNPVKRIQKYSWLAAASVILLVVAGWFWWQNNTGISMPDKAQSPAFVAQNGTRRQAVLPDGTKVWLNGGSRLFYNTDFKGATREITLEGEAFFDVVKKTEQPFIVHANDINIKVLGTAFNVRAYAEDGKTETTLYRGLVNITKSGDASFQPIMLYPNQKITVPEEILHDESGEDIRVTTPATIKKSIVIQQIDSTKLEPQRIETAWMYNRLEFRGDDFEELSAKLERWYNVKIAFGDENVKNLKFSGSFERENIQQALLALSIANSFNYKITGHEVFISSSNKTIIVNPP